MRQFFAGLLLILFPGYLNAQTILTNSDGHFMAGTGNVIFTTSSCPVSLVTDVDGNRYETVGIGAQCWMKQNLATTRYNDGTAIPNVTDNAVWKDLTTSAYCWYNNDAATNKATYGALYNGYSASATNPKNICPVGWHVPSASDWNTLIGNLGGQISAGGAMKETGLAHWSAPNESATNSSGFTALPGGARWCYEGGTPFFDGQVASAWFWGSTPYDANNAWSADIINSSAVFWIYNSYRMQYGLSVRCLKD